MKIVSRQNTLLWAFSIGLLVMMIGMAVLRVKEYEERIALLESQLEELQHQAILKDKEGEALQLLVDEKDEEIQGLYKPKPVDGPAQFPIARVLARTQDSVEALAQRENTHADVIFALNPWLEGSSELIKGQAIWIPIQ